MNGIHDCGGMEGFGPIPRSDAPVFTSDWERRTHALMLLPVAAGVWSLDEMRRAIERMPAADYLRASYYERWLCGIETLAGWKGLRAGSEGPDPASRQPDGEATPAAPRFGAGDTVVTRTINPRHHTRLPRYARGKAGLIVRDHGIHPFADSNAYGDPRPQHVYVVRFTARALWGEDASAIDTVCLDLWDDYLEPASHA